MNEVNYYQVLGVSESANAEEIKSAFRKLVRKYHPDVSSAADADDKITEINNAYEVLGDSNKKREYDLSLKKGFAHNFFKSRNNSSTNNPFTKSPSQDNTFKNSDSSKSKPGFYWEELKDKFGENSPFASSSFKFDDIFSELKSGYNKNNQQNTHDDSRKKYNKSSQADFSDLFKSEADNEVWHGEDQYVDVTVDLESVLVGATYNMKLSVPTRQTDGSVRHEEKQIKFEVPRGITEGMYIRLAEQGAASLSGSKNGDLYLKVSINTQDNISLEGGNIYQNFNITPWEAALGDDLTINTVTGNFPISIPSNSQTGQHIRIVGKGIPSMNSSKQDGDLVVVLNLVNPQVSSTVHKQSFENMKLAFKDNIIKR